MLAARPTGDLTKHFERSVHHWSAMPARLQREVYISGRGRDQAIRPWSYWEGGET